MAAAELIVQITGRDNASEVIEQVGNAAKNTGDQVAKAGDKVATAGTKMRRSVMDVATGFAGLTTAGFSLYSALDRVGDMQVSVDRANYQVKVSTEAVERAQNAYNAAVEKYGIDSPQAQQAAENIALAQEKLQIATDRAKMTQDNQNEALAAAALSVVPTAITAFKSLKDLTEGLGLSTGSLTSGLKALTTGFGDVRMAAVSIGAALGAVGAIFGAFTTTNEETRIALSLLAGGLIAAASAQWVLNAAVAAGLELSTLGAATVIVGIALASAAAVYAAASTFGAKVEGGGGVPSLSTPRREYIMTSTVGGTEAYFDAQGKCVQGPKEWIGLTREEIRTKFGYQHGGIVSRPTVALIGEAGTEIVLPESGRTSPQVLAAASAALERAGISVGAPAGIGVPLVVNQSRQTFVQDIDIHVEGVDDVGALTDRIVREFRRRTGVKV